MNLDGGWGLCLSVFLTRETNQYIVKTENDRFEIYQRGGLSVSLFLRYRIVILIDLSAAIEKC